MRTFLVLIALLACIAVAQKRQRCPRSITIPVQGTKQTIKRRFQSASVSWPSNDKKNVKLDVICHYKNTDWTIKISATVDKAALVKTKARNNWHALPTTLASTTNAYCQGSRSECAFKALNEKKAIKPVTVPGTPVTEVPKKKPMGRKPMGAKPMGRKPMGRKPMGRKPRKPMGRRRRRRKPKLNRCPALNGGKKFEKVSMMQHADWPIVTFMCKYEGSPELKMMTGVAYKNIFTSKKKLENWKLVPSTDGLTRRECTTKCSWYAHASRYIRRLNRKNKPKKVKATPKTAKA